MSLDFRNVNTLWSSVIYETLKALGLQTVIICPGSRSTPLTTAFTTENKLDTIAILDERSAAFFALGRARKTGLPSVIICTSGTAGANFYPAIIEAKESKVPLIVFTADRPPELRDCHSGQTIDQLKLYNNYPNWQTELATPSSDRQMLNYLRQTMIYAWERSLFPSPGVVHINIPFRDPLAPIINPEIIKLQNTINPVDFFRHITSQKSTNPHLTSKSIDTTFLGNIKGIIIAGNHQTQFPLEYCQAIAQIAKVCKFPVLAEGLSPIRNYAHLNPYLISTYDLILRQADLVDNFIPEIVIQLGDLPISKELRNWLNKHQIETWIIDPSYDNYNSLHTPSKHLNSSIFDLAKSLNNIDPKPNSDYLEKWLFWQQNITKNIEQVMNSTDRLWESKIPWLLSKYLPNNTALFIANSMPVRDVEFFWQLNDRQYLPFFNRGANGIDGTLSTALGVAYKQLKPTVMLTGDLSLLHDTNGFLINPKFIGSLTIILINNNGGGIFQMLPISQFDPPFEEYFATPQTVDFAKLATAYNIAYHLINNSQDLIDRITHLPPSGIQILEIKTDRQTDSQWRQKYLPQLGIIN